MTTYFGYNVPFITNSGRVMPRQEDEQLIKNDILQFILTVPGERVMRPNYGTPVISSLFEPLDDVTLDRLSNDIRNGILANDSRVLSVDVELTPLDNTLYIKIIAKFSIDPNKLVTIEQYLATGG
jgi:phage baseplate assembly protein W